MPFRPKLLRLSARLRGRVERALTGGPQDAAGERGASSIEYAFLIAGIAAVCVVVLSSLGVSVRDLFDALHF